MRRLLLSIVIIATTSMRAISGEHSFVRLSIEDGMSQSDITDMIQDDDGLMWFATNNGLNRYDGYNIHRYKRSNGIVDNVISSLARDNMGNIWIGTINGVCSYNTQLNSFTHYELKLPSNTNPNHHNNIRSIFCAKDSTVYIATNRDILSKGGDDSVFYPMQLNQDIGYINHIVSLRNTLRLIVATNRGLYMLNTKTQKVEKLLDKRVTAISQSQMPNEFYVSTGRETLLFNIDTQYRRELKYKNNHIDRVVDILYDSLGRVWIGTESNGVYLIDNDVVEHIEMLHIVDNSLSSNYILSIFEDSSQTIWIGTSNGGVNRYQEPTPLFNTIRHNVVDRQLGLSDNVVQAIYVESDAKIWIGTKGGYLNMWDRKDNTFTHYKSPYSNKINALALSADGNSIWIGCSDGLSVFNKSTETFSRWKSDVSSQMSYVNSLMLDSDSTLWCTTGYGVFAICKDGRVAKIKDSDNSPTMNNCRTIYRKDATSPIYAGFKYRGLREIRLIHNNDGSRHIETKNAIADSLLMTEDISTIYQDGEDNLYIGTWGNGIKRWDGKNLYSFTEADGLSDNIVFGIYEDNNNTLWISTYDGLSSLNTKDYRFRNYSYYYGIQSDEFSVGAHAQCTNGEIIFGGINGITHFSPKGLQSEGKDYPITLCDLYIYNQRVEPNVSNDGINILSQALNSSEEITLPHRFNTFSISLATISYANPYRNQFRYRLRGYDDYWHHSIGDPLATFSRVPSGEYCFEVFGASSDGSWSETPRSLKITITPPLYKSAAAYVIYAIIVLGLILFVARVIQHRMKSREEKIAERSQQEIYDARMRFYTNISHDLRTPLTLILGLIDKLNDSSASNENRNRLQIMKRNADLLLRLINDIIDVRKIETGNMSLDLERCNIPLFVNSLIINFEEEAKRKHININFETSTTFFSLIDRGKCEKILYNLLSNAMKFTNSTIDVMVECHSEIDDNNEEEWFEIKVQDNGMGISADDQERIFHRFFRGKEHHEQGSGIGLNVAFELSQVMNGVLRVDSQEGEGACFTLKLPIITDVDREFEVGIEFEKSEDDNKGGTILVIDDNADLRFLLRDTLQDSYKICEANNGAEGLEAINQLLPDLIICDIMMPGINGIEVCKQAKSNKDSALIPFILISARTSDDYKVEGLSYGADAYLTKPFSTPHIKAQIDSLLANRNAIREQLSIDIITKPQSISHISRKNKWLGDMVKLLEQHIDDPDYDIEKMSEDLAVSRMQLYRQFKNLLGQTPSDFVRDFKLTRAADLLINSDMSISEVCYAIGYNNPKYFRNLFIKRYDMAPTQYREEHRAERG